MSCRSKASIGALAFCVAVVTAGAPPAFATRGWVLEQRSPAGRQVVSLCADGMQVAGESLTFSMTAPAYDAKFWNTSTKRTMQIPYKEWQERYVSHKNRQPQLTKEDEKVAGLKCAVYVVPNPKNPNKFQKIWTSKEINLPSKFSNMMLSWLKLPEELGVPVRVYTFRYGKLWQKELDTVESKKSDIAMTAFKVPAGYTKVKNLVEVWEDPNVNAFEDAAGIFKE